MHKIAFICSANMCRSPMAEAIFAAEAARRGLQITVCSAGTWDFEGDLAAMDARLTCERHNTPMPKLLSTPLARVDLSDATRVFVMERNHIEKILAQTVLPLEKISLLGVFDPKNEGEEIDDPIGKGETAFEDCYVRLRSCIIHYLETTDDFKPASGQFPPNRISEDKS